MRAGAQPADTAALLEQTETLRTSNHSQFLRQLEQLHQLATRMSERELWRLRYLDAWQASFRGDYSSADPSLEDIIRHSGDPVLATKASAVLMDDLRNSRHYESAFELANQLIADLPKMRDESARYMVLAYTAQLLKTAGQYDLAVAYARDMMQALPAGETSCQPLTLLLGVLQASHKLTASSAEIERGLSACQAARQPLFGLIIELIKGGVYLDQGQPAQTVALIQQIAPHVLASGYHLGTLTARDELARAYLALGDDINARKAALAVLAISKPGDVNDSLRYAYQVLYQIEKKRGHAVAALDYYEHYAQQNASYLSDINARTMAYAVAQQRMLAQKLETEKLSRQNSVLLLQQTLAAKAIETGRLYIVLLLMSLASVIFWLFRTKRSQLHFKRQARLDGLTGIFNHQHFIGEARRALHLLERKRAAACLLFIDLDYFKQINDTHGHGVGDEVLKHAVDVCQQPLRAHDLFGRLGGEEFGVLLLECAHAQGMAIAERIRAAIESSAADMDGSTIRLSASIGLACTQSSGHGLQRLCREADAALYRAKRGGRNRVVSHAEYEDTVKLLHVGQLEQDAAAS